MRQAAFAGLLALAAGCIDFGYDMAGAVGDADGGGDADLGSCTEGVASPSASGPQVSLITLNVDKPTLTIASGDVVTWTNSDTMPHTVTAGAPNAEIPLQQGGFDSGDLATGAKWAYRFCTRRTVFYFCRTHPQQMNGFRVVVE